MGVRKYQVNDDFFKDYHKSSVAWVLGLIFADGYIQKNRKWEKSKSLFDRLLAQRQCKIKLGLSI